MEKSMDYDQFTKILAVHFNGIYLTGNLKFTKICKMQKMNYFENIIFAIIDLAIENKNLI